MTRNNFFKFKFESENFIKSQLGYVPGDVMEFMNLVARSWPEKTGPGPGPVLNANFEKSKIFDFSEKRFGGPRCIKTINTDVFVMFCACFGAFRAFLRSCHRFKMLGS